MDYLSKDDLAQKLYGIERYRPGDPATKDLYLAVSSGTSTGVPTAIVTHDPLDEWIGEKWAARAQAHVRLSRNRPTTFRILYRALCDDQVDRFVTLDAKDLEPAHLYQIMREFEPETLNGPPALALSFAERLTEEGGRDICERIELLQAYGEQCTPLIEQRLAALLPRASLKKWYALSWAAYLAESCPADTDRYHLFPDRACAVTGILDPDEDGIGEIVIRTSDLPAYRTGDLGTLDTAPCPCGIAPALIIHGRKDFDLFIVLGAVFAKRELERVLEPFMTALRDYQLRVSEVPAEGGFVGRAVLDIVVKRDEPELARAIRERVSRTMFVTRTRTLSALVDSGIFEPLCVRIVDAIPHGKKAVHLKHEA